MDYDLLAAEYARHRQVHPEVLRELLTTGRVTGQSRVLEIGCGTGNYSAALVREVGCRCWGIDPSAEMLACARQSASEIPLQRGMAEHLPFGDSRFELVFSVDVVHHVRDRRAYTREAHRVLQPGGALCTVTDSEEIIRTRRPLAVYFPETVEVELARYPRVGELTDLLHETGFRSVREVTAAFPYLLKDVQPFRDRAFSSLHLISDRAFRNGIARMDADLRAGPIACESRYVLVWGTK